MKPLKNYFFPTPLCYSNGDYDVHEILTASYNELANVRKNWPYFIRKAIRQLYSPNKIHVNLRFDNIEKVIKFISSIEGIFFSNPYYDLSYLLNHLYAQKYNLPETFFVGEQIQITSILRSEYKYCNVGTTRQADITLILDWDKYCN